MARAGRKRKMDYDSEEFYEAVALLAKYGNSDGAIAELLSLKFGKTYSPETFSRIKNEKDKDGNPTEHSLRLRQALAGVRHETNMAGRATYLQMALGQRKVKTVTSQRLKLQDGSLTEDEIITTVETELAPNMQALSTWLFNHDEDWREKTIKNKKEEVDAGVNELPSALNVRVTYNRKEDIQLQEKFEKPGQ